MDRGRAGKQSVLVMLLDTYAKSATPIDSNGVWVTDLSGNITWKFQGEPALFMGRHRNSRWTTASGIPTGRASHPVATRVCHSTYVHAYGLHTLAQETSAKCRRTSC
jgi:hypothetical protein